MAGTAVPEGLNWVGVRCLQTRWGGPMGVAELAVLMLSLRRLWCTGGIIHAGTKTVIKDDLQILRLDFGRDATYLTIDYSGV